MSVQPVSADVDLGKPLRLLIIDDEKAQRDSMTEILRRGLAGKHVQFCDSDDADGVAASILEGRAECELILADLHMPLAGTQLDSPLGGAYKVFEAIDRANAGNSVHLLITTSKEDGYGTTHPVVHKMEFDEWDNPRSWVQFCFKPRGAGRADGATLPDYVFAQAVDQAIYARKFGTTSVEFSTDVMFKCTSPDMITARGTAYQNRGQGVVLIVGEKGTPRDFFATYIHQCSGRRGLRYIFDCARPYYGDAAAALSEALDKAAVGTIYLANFGPSPQVEQILPLLETLVRYREYKLDSERQSFEGAVIIGCSPDIEETMPSFLQEGSRYSRVMVPPLRDLRKDIKYLAEYYLNKGRTGDRKGLSGLATDALRAYHWPDNVQEMQEMMRAVATRFVTETRITIELLKQVNSRLGKGTGFSRQTKDEKTVIRAFRRLREARTIYDCLLQLPPSRTGQNYRKVVEQSQPAFASEINKRYIGNGAIKVWERLADVHADIRTGRINPWRLAQHIWLRYPLDSVQLGRLKNEVADIRAHRTWILTTLVRELQEVNVLGIEQPLLHEIVVEDKGSLEAQLQQAPPTIVAQHLLERTCEYLFFKLSPAKRPVHRPGGRNRAPTRRQANANAKRRLTP